MSINLIIAFLIERFFGSIEFRFHPVKLLGNLISFYGSVFYRFKKKFFGGLFLTLCTIVSVSAVMILLEYVSPFFELPMGINILSIVLIYFLLCNRELAQETREVYTCLINGNLKAARTRVSRIVGRDTDSLDQKGVIRATVESVAENIVDGFTSPIFFLSIGGLPLAYLYRAINTIDSMYGYRDDKFERFGKMGARLDDIMNFIPARFNAFFILCATKFDRNTFKAMKYYGRMHPSPKLCATKFDRNTFKAMKYYGRMHPSPNSGISEAGFAGYLGIALGGPSYYQGKLKQKPWLGENRLSQHELEDPGIILTALSLYWKIVWITLIFFLILLLFLDLPIFFSCTK